MVKLNAGLNLSHWGELGTAERIMPKLNLSLEKVDAVVTNGRRVIDSCSTGCCHPGA